MLYQNIDSLPFIKNAVVTVGTFDGVHLAHRAILKEVVKSAKEIGGKSVVFTFSNHPRRVIDLDFQGKILSTVDEKNRILQKIGIDIIVYIEFTPDFAQTSCADFIKCLTQKIDIQKLYPYSLSSLLSQRFNW
jgi:riboflavin kinase/FMN adenylyltransferase